MRNRWQPIMAVATCLLLQAGPAAAYSDENEELRGLRDRFRLYTGGFFPNFDTQVRLDSTMFVGSIIRAESNLNLDSSTSNFRIGGHWRFTPRSSIEFELFDIERDALGTLEEEIRTPDTVYKLGAQTATVFNTAFLKAAYRWSFINKGRIDTGFSAGISVLDAEFSLRAVGAAVDDMGNPLWEGAGSDDENFTFPVPVIGQYLSLTLRERLFYRVGFELFIIDTADWQGSLVDIHLSVDYYFNKTVGIGLGYNNVSIEYDEQEGSPRIDVEYEFQGLMGYLSFVF